MRSHVAVAVATCVGVSLLSLISSAAYAQSAGQNASAGTQIPAPIGKVESLVGEVHIKHTVAVVVQANTGPEPGLAKAGDAVYQGDTVSTGPNSKLGIAFTDGTAFNLSSDAHMVLDKFVYDPNGKSNASLFSLSKGAFTFIAGKVARTGDMKVNTPVATMGIRGTAPHVEISEDGKVKFSTLVEEDKNKAAAHSTQPQMRGSRQGSAGRLMETREDLGAPAKAERDYDQNLKICKGC